MKNVVFRNNCTEITAQKTNVETCWNNDKQIGQNIFIYSDVRRYREEHLPSLEKKNLASTFYLRSFSLNIKRIYIAFCATLLSCISRSYLCTFLINSPVPEDIWCPIYIFSHTRSPSNRQIGKQKRTRTSHIQLRPRRLSGPMKRKIVGRIQS